MACNTGLILNIIVLNGKQEFVEGHWLFVFGRWMARALQNELTGRHTVAEWQKDVSSSLLCKVPISRLQRAARKISKALPGGKKRATRSQVHPKYCTYIQRIAWARISYLWEALWCTANQWIGGHPTARDIKATIMKRKSRSCFPQGLI